jgi:hypothetical protein
MQRIKAGLGLAAILALALMLGLGCATSQKAGGPPQNAKTPDWWFHDIVDVVFVQQYAKVPQPKGVMIIDARPTRAKFDKGFIPSAVNIPGSKFDKMVDKLPKDKSTLLIFYCQGPT